MITLSKFLSVIVQVWNTIKAQQAVHVISPVPGDQIIIANGPMPPNLNPYNADCKITIEDDGKF